MIYQIVSAFNDLQLWCYLQNLKFIFSYNFVKIQDLYVLLKI